MRLRDRRLLETIGSLVAIITLIGAVQLLIYITPSVPAPVAIHYPSNVSVSGSVNVRGAYDVEFLCFSGTRAVCGVNYASVANNAYSLSLPNQHGYEVNIFWKDQSGSVKFSFCGVALVNQTISIYNFALDNALCR